MEMLNRMIKAHEEYKQAMKDIEINKFFEEFFEKFPHVHAVIIQGFTPRFNDGDPCYHSQEVMMNCGDLIGSGYIYRGDTLGELDPVARAIVEGELGISGDDTLSPDVLYPERNNPEWEAYIEKYSEAHKTMEDMKEVFEFIYDTDFEIKVIRHADGAITVSKEGYDCGY